MCAPFLLPPLVNVLNSCHVQIQEGLSPNHLKKAKLMFFYTRYPSSNMLKMYFSDVKVSQRQATSLLFCPTVQPLQMPRLSSMTKWGTLTCDLLFLPQTIYLLCIIVTPATKWVFFLISSQGLRGLKETLFACKTRPYFFPLAKLWFYAKDERRGS